MQDTQAHQSKFRGVGILGNQAAHSCCDRRQSTGTEGHHTYTSCDTYQELRTPDGSLADVIAEINHERLEFGMPPLDEQQEVLVIKVFKRAQRLPKNSFTSINENTEPSQPTGKNDPVDTIMKEFLSQQMHRDKVYELREKLYEQRERFHEEREVRHEERAERLKDRLEDRLEDVGDLIKLRLDNIEKQTGQLDRLTKRFAIFVAICVLVNVVFILAIKDLRCQE